LLAIKQSARMKQGVESLTDDDLHYQLLCAARVGPRKFLNDLLLEPSRLQKLFGLTSRPGHSDFNSVSEVVVGVKHKYFLNPNRENKVISGLMAKQMKDSRFREFIILTALRIVADANAGTDVGSACEQVCPNGTHSLLNVLAFVWHSVSIFHFRIAHA
jgi:hypothetical protein